MPILGWSDHDRVFGHHRLEIRSNLDLAAVPFPIDLSSALSFSGSG
jgi:hypothetical protein